MTSTQGAKLRVLVTGAGGVIGTALCAGLPRRGWTVRAVDVNLGETGSTEVEYLSLSVTDAPAMAAAMADVDVVVHLGGLSREGDFGPLLQTNIGGTAVVLEAAWRAGITRVIVASSSHSIGYWPMGDVVADDLPPRPDSFYGVSKAAVEALGQLYVDKYGMTVVAARIGTCTARPHSVRHLSTWLSLDDMVRFVDAALRSPRQGFFTPFVVSANTRRVWSLDQARALGYLPHDDAEDFAEDVISTSPVLPEDHPDRVYIGGTFVRDDPLLRTPQ